MTKTNEPQDPFLATQNESEGESSQSMTPGQTGESNKDFWSDNLDTESVEEAFLALIQSNKPQEHTSDTSSTTPTDSGMQAEVNEQASVPDITEEEANAYYSISQSVMDERPVQPTEAAKDFQPYQPASEEGSLHERLAEEIFSDLNADELPDVTANEGQSITDALSETIAESLAELQSGQVAEENNVQPAAAVQQQQQPQQFHSQNPVTPEFPDTNKQEGFPAHTAAQNQQPQEFVPQIMPYEALEENLQQSNNDVVNQQHAQPISFENRNTNPPQNVSQVQEVKYASEYPTAGNVPPQNVPPQNVPPQNVPPQNVHSSINVTPQDGAKRNNVDPEFQALVQWSNSDVEPSYHGPNDIPNFLSQKREEENRFSFKTVFISVGISAVVISMFYLGYQAGSTKNQGSGDVYDATANKDDNRSNGIRIEKNRVAENSFSGDNSSTTTREERKVVPKVKPKASILEFSVADVSGFSGKKIPLNITLEGNNLGLETMVMFRGIPDEIKLSRGLNRDGLWSVPISDLDKLALVVPRNFTGSFDFEVFAFKDPNSTPEKRLAKVSIQPTVVKRRVPQVRAETQPKIRERERSAPQVREKPKKRQVEIARRPPEKKKSRSVVAPNVERAMLQRGNELLKNGDISGARLVFEHVASLGSMHAAFALARTYDEEFTEQLPSVVPQMELAVKWYKKAASMGHSEAISRLRQLGLR